MSDFTMSDIGSTEIILSDSLIKSQNMDINQIDVISEDKEPDDNHLKGMLSFLTTSDIEDNDIDVSIANIAKVDETILSSVDESMAHIPAKRNTKTYEQDKIKLLSESQRLLRETAPHSFKYKPVQFKTFGLFKNALQLKKQSQNNHDTRVIDNKENIVDIELKQPQPLRDRLNLSDGIKASLSSHDRSTAPIDYAKKIDNLLRMQNKNAKGIVELKSKEANEQAKIHRDELLNSLNKKMLRTVNIVEEDSFTDISTIVKAIDPETGVTTLTSKVVTVKRDPSTQSRKATRDLEPIIASQAQARLSANELIEWNLMSSKEKYKYHKQLLLKDADKKRRELREKRMKDMPVVNVVKKSTEKIKDNDGLSDDDTEWVDENEDNSGDSDEDSNEEEEVTEVEESEDDLEVSRIKKRGTRAIIDDDDEQEEKVDTLDTNITVNTSENLTLESSFLKDSVRVVSPNGIGSRERRRCEMSPTLERDPKLATIALPESVLTIIAGLKTKYGLVNKLDGVESSVLLLPTMKTTTTCIENLFKQQIVTRGLISQQTLSDYRQMLLDKEPQMLSTWTDQFNLLSSININEYHLASYSFLNASLTLLAAETVTVVPESLLDMDDTMVMAQSRNIDMEDSLPATEIIMTNNDDATSDTTVLLPSAENSRDCEMKDNSLVNNIHAKLFQFEAVGERETNASESKTAAQQIFANLSSMMKDTEEDREDDKEEDREEDKEEDMEEDKEEDMEDENEEDKEDVNENESENEDIDDVDLDDTDNEVDENDVSENDESLKSEAEYDEDDEEEVLRKHVQSGTRFLPTDYIDEEAALSGSDAEDYGSDEDERGLDEYEDEEGDQDKLPSAGKLRRQIERIHNKLEIDKDAHDIRYIKEMYLEDGDLNLGDEGPRKRRFAWDGINDDEEFVRVGRGESDGDQESEYEDQALSAAVIDEQVSDTEANKEAANELVEKYGKIFARSRSVIFKPEESQLRSAWSTDLSKTSEPIVVPARPQIKKFGSMLNKAVSSIEVAKAPTKTMNDFDLKTRMSVMYNNATRPSDALKRTSSFVQSAGPKKQKSDQS